MESSSTSETSSSSPATVPRRPQIEQKRQQQVPRTKLTTKLHSSSSSEKEEKVLIPSTPPAPPASAPNPSPSVHSSGKSLALASPISDAEKEKRKARQAALLRESLETPLTDLEVITVDSSEKGEVLSQDEAELLRAQTVTSGMLPREGKLSYLDLMPDDLVFNIIDHMDERDTARVGEVSRRYLALTEDPRAWETKIAKWHTIKADLRGKTKQYYVSRFREHEMLEEQNRLSDLMQERHEHKEIVCRTADPILYRLFFTRISNEWSWLFGFIFYSFLLPLQLDGILSTNWHFIHIPIYAPLIWTSIGLLVFRSFWAYGDGRTLWPRSFPRRRELESSKSAMIIFYSIPDPILWVPFFWTVLCFILFFVLLAESKNDPTGMFDAIPAGVMWWVMAGGLFVAFCYGACLQPFILFFLPLVFYAFWTIAFLWARAEEWVDFNWFVALIPWWLVLIPGFLAAIIGLGILAWTTTFPQHAMMMYAWVATSVGVGLLITFLALVAYNLDQEYADLPMMSWVAVFAPLQITLLLGIGGCGVVEHLLNR